MIVCILVIFVQAYAKEEPATYNGGSQDCRGRFVDKAVEELTNKLVGRALKVWPLDRTDLENAMLAKSQRIQSYRTPYTRPVHPAVHSKFPISPSLFPARSVAPSLLQELRNPRAESRTKTAAAAAAQSMTSATATSSVQIKYYNKLVESLPSLVGKCVAITGTTSGLGYWAAAATAKKGASCLILLNRQSDRAIAAEEEVRKQAAPGVAVISVTCDLQNMSSVREAAINVNRIVADFGGLDVLALNAGIMSQPDTRTVDGFDTMMQTNHLSQVLLTKLVMPSLRAAAAKGKEVRIVTHSSIARRGPTGGPIDVEYYLKSPAGSLGGDEGRAKSERYHQSKLANIAFAMALHASFEKLALFPLYSNFKALSAAPGVSDTSLDFGVSFDNIPPWLKNNVALSAPDGSCPLLTAMFSVSAKSGDFYEPESLFTGPPIKVISEGVPLPPQFPRQLLGIRDDMVCTGTALDKVWKFSETGLGEKFFAGEGVEDSKS